MQVVSCAGCLFSSYLISLPIRLFWRAVRPFLHENTQQKIVLVPAGKERDVIGETIDPACLETDFGGDSAHQFDPDAYLHELGLEEALLDQQLAEAEAAAAKSTARVAVGDAAAAAVAVAVAASVVD